MPATPRPLPASWAVLVDAWERTERAAGRSPATLSKRRIRLARLASDHPEPFALTASALADWCAAQRWEPGTEHGYRATLRGFYSWATGAGLTQDNPTRYLSKTGTARPFGATGPLAKPVPSAWEDALTAWARDRRAAGRPRTTIRTQVDHLRRFARAAGQDPFDVTTGDVIDWMADQDWSIETRRAYRSTFRTFYAWATTTGRVAINPALQLPSTGTAHPNPRPASEQAYRYALMAATPRERLMLRLAAEMGLRRAEVAAVHSRDLMSTDGGWSLLVHGKGSRERVVPMPDALAALLRELPPGYAFPSPSRAGHLSPRWVGKVVTRLLPPGVTMHALRHRFATRAYGLAHDVFAVQQLLGHASPTTTRRYVAISDDRLRSTVAALAALDRDAVVRTAAQS